MPKRGQTPMPFISISIYLGGGGGKVLLKQICQSVRLLIRGHFEEAPLLVVFSLHFNILCSFL